MTNRSAGAGRDGSRLRAIVDRMEDYEASVEDRAAIANWAFELRELLAVPDPLASDTGQGKAGEQVQLLAKRVTCNEHTMGVLCEPCRKEGQGCLRLWAKAGEWPLASSSAPQGETSLLGSLNVALWGVNSHTYAPGVVDRVLAWLTEHGR